MYRPGEMCFACHGTNTQNGPHTASIEEHTHHKPGSAGSQMHCLPYAKIEQTIADVNVAQPYFQFRLSGADRQPEKCPGNA